jgi:hypothetical protein
MVGTRCKRALAGVDTDVVNHTYSKPSNGILNIPYFQALGNVIDYLLNKDVTHFREYKSMEEYERTNRMD